MEIMKFTGWRQRLVLCMTALMLLSCSGGSSSEPVAVTPPIANPPPPSVSISQTAAAKFLTQSSFGPTTEDITRMSDMGYTAWLDEQFNLPKTSQLAYIDHCDAKKRVCVPVPQPISRIECFLLLPMKSWRSLEAVF